MVAEDDTRQIPSRRLSLRDETRDRLRRYGLKAKKGLGQHFLIDEEVLKDIITEADISSRDTVLEIGPGLGVLTGELSRAAGKVVTVELDGLLANRLAGEYRTQPDVIVLNRDILEATPGALLREATGAVPAHYKVVHLLEAEVKPEAMLLMLQREVAETIVAPPGKLSLLALSVRFYGVPQIVRAVPASAFYPVPKVASALLRIDLLPEPAVAVADVGEFFRFIKAGFKAPRKQLANSLSRGLCRPRAEILPKLTAAGIDPARRPGTLSLEVWANLERVFEGAEC